MRVIQAKATIQILFQAEMFVLYSFLADFSWLQPHNAASHLNLYALG